jgi:hypothetical protein
LKNRDHNEPAGEFNLQDQIDIWSRRINSESSVTEADAEELKAHLLDLMDELKESGLDEEEAFWVASKRLGTATDWGNEYLEANNSVIQIRRSAIILSGVLVYFLFYHFFEFSSKLLLSIFLYKGINAYMAIDWIYRYLIGTHFIMILLFASIYFMEKKVVSFIENIKFKPGHTLLLLLITFVFAIINLSLSPVVRNMLNKELIDHFIHIYRNYYYSFPLTVCIGFILIYFKYYKTSKF